MKALLLVLLVGCGEVKNAPVDAARSDGTTHDQAIAIDAALDANTSPHLVFVTSTTHPGRLGGLTGADTICQARAGGAGLAGTYKAWLADAMQSPATRMTHGAGPYQLVSGTVIAQNWTDLTDGTLSSPVNRTEGGALLGGSGCTAGAAGCNFICEGGEFWSNVAADGSRAAAVADCGTWADSAANGTAGNVGKTTSLWTAGNCTPIGCSSMLPIMCVQQ